MPLISVIVPIYNVEKYVRKCVDSILAQTLTDIEIILVNDGSTDGCPKICDEYAARDSRVKVLHHENGGYGKAVNSGIREAQGNYIGIVESDDWIDLTMYEKLHSQAIKTNADVVKCSFYFVTNEQKNHKHPFTPLMELAGKDEVFSIKEKPQLLREHASLWSAIYKRDFIQRNHISLVETPGASYQDWPFVYLVYAKATSISMVSEPLLFYRDEASNTNASSHTGGRSMLYIIQQAATAGQELKDNNLYTGEMRESFTEQAFRVPALFMNRISDESKEEFYQSFKRLLLQLANDGSTFSLCTPEQKHAIGSILVNHSFLEHTKQLHHWETRLNRNAVWPNESIYYQLFGFFPILAIIKRTKKIKYKLFNFIPLLKLKKN